MFSFHTVFWGLLAKRLHLAQPWREMPGHVGAGDKSRPLHLATQVAGEPASRLLQDHPIPNGWLPLASATAHHIPLQSLHAAPAHAAPTAGVFLAWKSATKS